MSTARSRLILTHRCEIQRDASTPGGWGDPATPDWQAHLTDQPCYTWVTAGHEIVDAQTSVVVEDMRLILPLDTDVTEQDRVGDVTARGTTIIAGPVQIRAVIRYRDFIELALVRLH